MERPPGEAATTAGAPLVSLFMFVRNGVASVRRAIDSVRAQTYPNIEFIVQDGASTDGTLDIIRSYGSGIELISEPDNGPSDGLWRALNRCSGEFIGSCLADEELQSTAVDRAVSILKKNPDVGAITGDAILTDLAGTQTGFWKSGPFNLVDYLLCDYTPYFVSSFFRRHSLLEAGLKTAQWRMDCIEFELWCRLASHTRIMYVPETFAKYASHSGQSSSNPRDAVTHFKGRLELIASMCGSSGLFDEDPALGALFIWGHARAFINHALSVGRPELAQALHRTAREVAARLPPFEVDGIPYDENLFYRQSAELAWDDLLSHIPAFLRAVVRPSIIDRWGGSFKSALLAARYVPSQAQPSGRDAAMAVLGLKRQPSDKSRISLPPPASPELRAKMYARLAERYEAANRFREASETWRAAARIVGIIAPVPAEERIGYTAA